jgi:hypothetical protein
MPSKNWKEVVAADEAARHAEAARTIADIQRRKSAKYGTGRALHRKGLVVAPAEFEVLGGLPAHATHGLLAAAGRYPASVRLSNGGVDVKSDRMPDIRGFAFRVHGLPLQPSALGGQTEHQDFSLINQAAFAFPTSHHFFGLVAAGAQSPGAVLKWVFKTFGFFGGLKKIKTMKATFGKPFPGFAAQTFGSTLPVSCGPYAVKWRLKPVNGQPAPVDCADWGADFLRQLQAGPLHYELQAQFFEDEARTPIEIGDQEWLEADAPFLTVAKLTVKAPPADAAWQQQAEAGTYDPWQALAAHRPLGEVQRARKVVYFASQQGRGAA